MVRTLGNTAVRINTDERLLSENGHFEFIGKINGDFCIHQLVGKKQEIWHPHGKRWGKAAKHGVKKTFFQAQGTDGNVVAYVETPGGSHSHWWESGHHHHGSGKNMLKLWNDGNLCAYRDINDLNSIYWATCTQIDTSFYTEKEKLEKELKSINDIVVTINNKLQDANKKIIILNQEIEKLTNENNQLRQKVEEFNGKMKQIISNSDKLADSIEIIKQFTESNDRLNERVKLLEQKVKILTQLLTQRNAEEKEMNMYRDKYNNMNIMLSRFVFANA